MILVTLAQLLFSNGAIRETKQLRVDSYLSEKTSGAEPDETSVFVQADSLQVAHVQSNMGQRKVVAGYQGAPRVLSFSLTESFQDAIAL